MSQELNDDELMIRVQGGDTRAFDRLYARHRNAVYGYCMRVFSGNRAQVDDVVQEAWIKVVRNAAGYEPRGNFKGWLMTIARNEAIAVFRKKVPDLTLDEPEAPEPADGHDVEKELLSAYGVERIRSAIDSLPDSQRAVLCLWVEQDASYDTICRELSLEWNSVRALLYRARQNLKQKLEGE